MKPARPVILAEGGAVEPRHTGPFKLYEKDKAGIILHDVLFVPFFAGAAGGGQCWHWAEYVDRNNLWSQFRGLADVVKGIDPAAEAFAPMMFDHPRLRVYILKGKRTTLVWCRDTQNTWQAELEQGKQPEELSGLSLALEPIVPLAGKKISSYNPWTRTAAPLAARGGDLPLPSFSRSIVVRLESQ